MREIKPEEVMSFEDMKNVLVALSVIQCNELAGQGEGRWAFSYKGKAFRNGTLAIRIGCWGIRFWGRRPGLYEALLTPADEFQTDAARIWEQGLKAKLFRELGEQASEIDSRWEKLLFKELSGGFRYNVDVVRAALYFANNPGVYYRWRKKGGRKPWDDLNTGIVCTGVELDGAAEIVDRLYGWFDYLGQK